jgi:single-strand DNA-binding protein
MHPASATEPGGQGGVPASVAGGAHGLAQGRLKQPSFETKEGDKRTVIELEVDEIGPSLRHATATVAKTARSDGGPGGGIGAREGGAGVGRGGSSDPLAAPVGVSEEPAF